VTVSPWPRREAAIVLALNVIGALTIAGGWGWASGHTILDDQIPAIAVTVAGLVVAGLADIAWLVAGRRGLARRKRTLFAAALDGR
jgi:hypothetical protein